MTSHKESKICMDSFDNIVEGYTNPIFRYCFHMLRNRHEAEDAVQDVFIKAYKAWSKESSIRSAASWLYKIAYNHCLNIIRRRRLLEFVKLTEEISSDQVSLLDEVADGELSEELKQVLSLLSAEQRTVILLRVIEEMEYEEIGAVLNKKGENIRKIYERTKRRLQSYWNIEKEVVIHGENKII